MSQFALGACAVPTQSWNAHAVAFSVLQPRFLVRLRRPGAKARNRLAWWTSYHASCAPKNRHCRGRAPVRVRRPSHRLAGRRRASRAERAATERRQCLGAGHGVGRLGRRRVGAAQRERPLRHLRDPHLADRRATREVGLGWHYALPSLGALRHICAREGSEAHLFERLCRLNGRLALPSGTLCGHAGSGVAILVQQHTGICKRCKPAALAPAQRDVPEEPRPGWHHLVLRPQRDCRGPRLPLVRPLDGMLVGGLWLWSGIAVGPCCSGCEVVDRRRSRRLPPRGHRLGAARRRLAPRRAWGWCRWCRRRRGGGGRCARAVARRGAGRADGARGPDVRRMLWVA
mmetsp:Transcript_139998/g.447758  ORF Transcript_139998/g.447758 Transcript_139998/m.447758 type:complete len:344 (-) Transcript_139998:384-1415(-)